MKEIIIVSPAHDHLTDFAAQLAQTSGSAIVPVATPAETLAAVSRPSALLVVIDGRMSGDNGKQLIRDILMTNAMIASAVLSDMPEEDFHETMEGLGVLMQLPAFPRGADAAALWKRIREVNGNL